MSKESYLIEKYLMRTPGGHGGYEIFVNPSQKEIRKIEDGSGIRLIADPRDKKVYIWDALEDIHVEAWEKIKPGENYDSLMKKAILLSGNAKKIKGKYTMYRSDQLDYYQFTKKDIKRLKEEFKWVNKYIDVNYTLDGILKGEWENVF